uniref:BTB domain-containing protein n=1 Tax=Bracon brevicornis TaxID=1563983 RepID=A0A6V7IXH6_9HYME
MNTLKVTKSSQNLICIEWHVRWKALNNDSSIVSIPFTMISGQNPVAFALQFRPQMSLSIYSSESGRSIVKLIVESLEKKKTSVFFFNNWALVNHFEKIGDIPSTECELRIHCSITWLGLTTDSTSQDMSELPVPSVPLDNTYNPDLYMIIENKVLPAHKLILTCHSRVLAASFATPINESGRNEIVINEVDYSTMEIILGIIYTGMTDDLDDIETALKVLKTTERYQMLTVKSVCETKLQLSIRDDNVLRFLDEANRHNASNLCNTCVEYITARNGKVLSHENLQKFAEGRPIIKAAICNLWFSLAKGLTITEV